jgi:hypothetical protein
MLSYALLLNKREMVEYCRKWAKVEMSDVPSQGERRIGYGEVEGTERGEII